MTPVPRGKPGERGFISVLVVLVMIAAIVAVGLALSNASVSEVQHGFYSQSSQTASEANEGCLEDALFRLKRDNSATGTTLTVGSSTCAIVLPGTNPSRTFSVTSTIDVFTPQVDGSITVSGRNVTLTNWQPYAGF